MADIEEDGFEEFDGGIPDELDEFDTADIIDDVSESSTPVKNGGKPDAKKIGTAVKKQNADDLDDNIDDDISAIDTDDDLEGPTDIDDDISEIGDIVDIADNNENLIEKLTTIINPTDAENEVKKINQIHKEIIICKPENRKTSDYLTFSEMTEAVGIRANDIEKTGKTFIDIPPGVTDAITIAKLELNARRSPLIIRRIVGTSRNNEGVIIEYGEDWVVKDMKYPFTY
jgi:hypothetical protein